jgi:nitrate reductase delta subunit
MDYATFARLLDYPTEGVPEAVDATQGQALSSLSSTSPEVRELLDQFTRAAAALGPGRLEEVYAATFDLQPERTLNMSHHLFADEWKRSAMLIELKTLFQRHAVDPGSELPDHLCWLLRLMAAAPADAELHELRARMLVPALRALNERMPTESNPYPPLLRALYLVVSDEEART